MLKYVEVRKSAVIFASLLRVWGSTDTTLYRTFFRAENKKKEENKNLSK